MQPGDYTFRIYGKIGNYVANESFTSSPYGPAPSRGPGAVQFPKAG